MPMPLMKMIPAMYSMSVIPAQMMSSVHQKSSLRSHTKYRMHVPKPYSGR